MKGSENQGEFWVSQRNKALNWDKLAKNGSRRATIRQPNFMWPELWAENGQKLSDGTNDRQKIRKRLVLKWLGWLGGLA